MGNTPAPVLLEAGLCLAWAETCDSSLKSRDLSQEPVQKPRERFICHPCSTRGMEGHILAPALLPSRSAQDAPSQDMPLLAPGALRQLMLLFLLLIPLLGTGPWIALVCITAVRPSQLGLRSRGRRLPALLLPLRGRVQGSALRLGSGGDGEGKGLCEQTALLRRAGAHGEAGVGLCSVVREPVFRLGESGRAVVAEMFPGNYHHRQGWVWGQEWGQPAARAGALHLSSPAPLCLLPQAAQSCHAEGALAACPLPITPPQKPVRFP